MTDSNSKHCINETLVSLGFGIFVGILVGKRHRFLRSYSFLRKFFSGNIPHNAKMVLVVRSDLKMGKGKMCAQCAHAAVIAYENALTYDHKGLDLWRRSGQAKVTLQTNSEESLIKLYNEARKNGLSSYIVQDAGRTQLDPLTRTVLVIGPGNENKINQVTGHLKLL